MKRVKSDWRCTLGNDTMDMLVRVKIEGPKKQADYRPRAAVNRWWMSDHKIDTLIHFFQFIFAFQVAKIFTLI